MAARLAGLIAGAQGMPVTILKLASAPAEPKQQEVAKDEDGGAEHVEQDQAKDMAQKDMAGAQSRVQSNDELKTDPLAREVKAGAKRSAARVMADEAEPDPEKVHLTARVPLDAPADMVRSMAAAACWCR
jgi:hypothetical protein